MKKRIVAIVALFLIMTFMFAIVSCGGDSKASNDYAVKEEFMGEAGSTEIIDKTQSSNSGTSINGTKIIKTADITAETKKYDMSTEELKALIESMEGHISKSSVSENSSYRSDGKIEKFANYTIKVPSEKFDEFISKLSTIFNVTNLSTSTQDVSESYFTLQARIDTLESKREGLLSMLKNVDANTDFTTWQKINAELTEIDTQLNIYNEQMKSLENKIAYSTVTLYVREVAEYTETDEKGYGAEILDAFKGSVEVVGEFFKDFLLMMIYVFPFLIILGGCAVVIIVIVRSSKRRKKVRAKKDEDKDKNENR